MSDFSRVCRRDSVCTGWRGVEALQECFDSMHSIRAAFQVDPKSSNHLTSRTDGHPARACVPAMPTEIQIPITILLIRSPGLITN